MFKSKFLFTLIVGLSLCASTQAALSPLGLAIISPVEFPPEDTAVAGLRLNVLLGKHRNVYGVDVGGIGNVTTINFGGIAQVAGLFNLNRGTSTFVGLQAAGVANVNINKAQIYGLQVAVGVNYNDAESTIVGVQIAPIANVSKFSTLWGVQVGLYNSARNVRGLQIGLINMADSVKGLQIGLINFNKTGLFAVCPGLNFGF